MLVWKALLRGVRTLTMLQVGQELPTLHGSTRAAQLHAWEGNQEQSARRCTRCLPVTWNSSGPGDTISVNHFLWFVPSDKNTRVNHWLISGHITVRAMTPVVARGETVTEEKRSELPEASKGNGVEVCWKPPLPSLATHAAARVQNWWAPHSGMDRKGRECSHV